MNSAVLLVFVSSLLAAVAQGLYKFGSAVVPFSWFHWALLSGLFVYCVAGFLIIISLKFVDMSVVFPVLALSFVWTALLSVLFFHEMVSVLNWFGVLLITLGVFGVSR